MTDLEQEPGGMFEQIPVHVVLGAARPRHTLLGIMARTSRWTLATLLAGHIRPEPAHVPPGVFLLQTSSGKPVTRVDSLYYDN